MACWPAAYIGAALFPRDPTTWTMPSGQLDAVARRAGETRRRVPVRRRVAKLRIVWPATRALHCVKSKFYGSFAWQCRFSLVDFHTGTTSRTRSARPRSTSAARSSSFSVCGACGGSEKLHRTRATRGPAPSGPSGTRAAWRITASAPTGAHPQRINGRGDGVLVGGTYK